MFVSVYVWYVCVCGMCVCMCYHLGKNQEGTPDDHDIIDNKIIKKVLLLFVEN